jgi:hypothetical protein
LCFAYRDKKVVRCLCVHFSCATSAVASVCLEAAFLLQGADDGLTLGRR